MNIRPYVYRCEHKTSGRFYIGYRRANNFPSMEDLGIHYFTSSKEVRKNFAEYKFEVLSEYDSAIMAYEVEQLVIYENRNNPLLINKNYKVSNHITLDPKPVCLKPAERYKKIQYPNGPKKRSENTLNGVKKRKSRERRIARRLADKL